MGRLAGAAKADGRDLVGRDGMLTGLVKLKGLPEAINGTWPQTVVQTCIVHLLRNTFRYVPRQH